MQFDVVANDKATATMAQVEKSMGRFGKGMVSNISMIASRAMALIGTIKTVSNMLTEMGDVADQAARLGMNVEDYQKLKFAAEDYGSSVEEIAKAQKDINKLLDAAATKGAGPEMDTLKALGFSEKDILARTVKQAEVWERLGDAIKGAKNEEEKFAVASRVLGDKISTTMVPVLENHKEFKSLMASTSALSQENANNLDKAGTKINSFWQFTKAISGEAAGWAAGKLMDKEPKFIQKPNPEADAENARRRAALLKVGATSKKVEAGEVSSMMAIGGASFRGFGGAALARPIEEQQLSALEQIASNTSPATETAPSVGSTNMTTAPSPANPAGQSVDAIRSSVAVKQSNYERFLSMRPAR